MPLSFSAQRVTTLDVTALTDCFNNSFDDFKNNMPWHYVNRTLEADGVPEGDTRTWTISAFQQKIDFDDLERGFVFSVTDPEQTKTYAYFTAQKDENTMIINMMLLNAIDGSKSWTSDFWSSEALKDMMAGLGMTRWKTKVYGNGIWSSLDTHFSHEGTPDMEANVPGVLYSPYGWD